MIAKVRSILKMPIESIWLDTAQIEGINLYRTFNSRHPRFPIFKYKTIGIAIIKLIDFKSKDEYLNLVSGKNSAAYFNRKAAKNGYHFCEFDPNAFHNSILEIHQSTPVRQGQPILEQYLSSSDYPFSESNRYFGVFIDSKLVAYSWLILSGELALINRIMGHNDHLDKGIMYMLLTEMAGTLINEKKFHYLMYDTYLGASEGLKLFKKRVGFKPYRVKWLKS